MNLSIFNSHFSIAAAAALSLAAASANADISITDVTARQRWPWNGLVDIDFTITGAAAGDAFAIDIDATAASGATSLSAKTYVAEPVAGAGANRIVWDLGADYPEFRANDLLVSVTATPLSDSTPIYMVIDLSGGADATKYPVRYTTQPPAHVQGAADEPCQTTELWMRRIVVDSNLAFPVNSYSVDVGDSKNGFWGKMTKDYYIGVFELTQKQYQLVMGSWPNSYFTNEIYRASRPVSELTYRTLTGTQDDVQESPSSVTAASFLGKIRAKAGLAITLPSNIQLNFAQRGGTKLDSTTSFYRYDYNGTTPTSDQIARYNADTSDRNCDATVGTAYVGSYLPNDYGLYDTIGNVAEYTAERYRSGYQGYYKTLFSDDTIGVTSANPVVNPPGVAAESAATDMGGSTTYYQRLMRGGYWSSTSAPTLWTMEGRKQNTSDGTGSAVKGAGFRLSMTVE